MRQGGRQPCSSTSNATHAAMANVNSSKQQSSSEPIPMLPPKKHRSSSVGPPQQKSSTVANSSFNANICDEHEYDEYCPQYELQLAQQQQNQQQQQHQQQQQQHAGRHANRTMPSNTNKHQQRAATFDVADARDYELQRLGNRRQNNGIKITSNAANGKTHHRSERTHDRERSRSDHRIASYACEETVANLLQQQRAAAAAAAQSQQRREKTFKV